MSIKVKKVSVQKKDLEILYQQNNYVPHVKRKYKNYLWFFSDRNFFGLTGQQEGLKRLVISPFENKNFIEY